RLRGRRARLDTRWRVPFTNQVTPKQFASHIAITPTPRELSSNVWGSDGVIHVHLDAGVLYTVTVTDGLRDVLGNTLRAPLVATFRAQDLPPALALPNESLVLEAGRAKLPIQVTNLATGVVTTQKYTHAGDWLTARQTGTACTGTESPIDL